MSMARRSGSSSERLNSPQPTVHLVPTDDGLAHHLFDSTYAFHDIVRHGVGCLGNELIASKTTLISTGPVRCRAPLGGLLKFYHRDAA